MPSNIPKCLGVLIILLSGLVCQSISGATLSGAFTKINSGANVNLTGAGLLDWVHWGLYTATSIDRKAGVTPQIGNFTVIGPPNAFVAAYQYSDNFNGYSWSDGTPTASINDTTTGVWAYGTALGAGFEMTVPADTTLKTVKFYVGAFAAKGSFQASLSDLSAPNYTDTSVINKTNGPGGVYTLQFAANSAGQTLTIRYTAMLRYAPSGNVTLQAAALTSTGANNPPIVSITSPTENDTFTASANITITADASDLDGKVAKVEFYDGATKLGEDTSSPYSFSWNGVPAGYHVLTAVATDTNANFSTSVPVEIFVNGTGGALSGANAGPPNTLDLTLEGTSDWAHWGLTDASSFDHKNGAASKISNFTVLGTNVAQQYADNLTAYSWSDGTPTASATNSSTGVYLNGLTNGFEIQAPADTTVKRLKVYVGLYGARGNFQAYLSDFSARAYTDTTISNVYGNSYAVFTLDYSAASAGQSLIIQYRSMALYDFDFGNVTLQAATLVATNSGNNPPTASITSPSNGASFMAPATITINATAGGGTVTNVEFFQGATKLGQDTSSPYSLTWSTVLVGNYTLTVRATDNRGVTTTSAGVAISVTNSAALPVTLHSEDWFGSDFIFSFASQSGHSYEVQFKGALGSGSWAVLTNLTGNGATLTVTNKNPSSAFRFYRVETK